MNVEDRNVRVEQIDPVTSLRYLIFSVNKDSSVDAHL